MPKKPQSDKAKAASKKNLENWESKQAEANRVSNDKEVADKAYGAGFLAGKQYGFAFLCESMDRVRNHSFPFIAGFFLVMGFALGLLV